MNVFSVSKLPAFQFLLHLWEHKRGVRSVVGQMGWDTTTILFFSQKGGHFADIAEVHGELLVALKGISVEDIRQCFQQWELRPDRCIQSQWHYLKGTKVSNLYNYFK